MKVIIIQLANIYINMVNGARIGSYKTHINTLSERREEKLPNGPHTLTNVCPLNETIKISQKTEHNKKRLRGESATSGHCASLEKA